LLKSKSGGEVEATSTSKDGAATQETVIVTSQYRKERLQDTPISESAMSAGELARRNVTDPSSLAGTVPGLFIGAANATNGTNLISLRGISGLAAAGASHAVAVYLDGVYLPRPARGPSLVLTTSSASRS